jgi:hypothetical protein
VPERRPDGRAGSTVVVAEDTATDPSEQHSPARAAGGVKDGLTEIDVVLAEAMILKDDSAARP